MDSPTWIAPFRRDDKPRAVWPAGLTHLEALPTEVVVSQNVTAPRRAHVDCRCCRHELHRRCYRPSKCTGGDQFEPMKPLQLWSGGAS